MQMMQVCRAALLGAVALASACVVRESSAPAPPPPAYAPPPPPPMVPAAVVTVTAPEASGSLSEAQCNHEAKCNRIGPTQRYSDWTHCMNIARQAADQKFSNCRNVRQAELTNCLNEITTEGCGFLSEPLDSFERAYACRGTALCYD
jgi:hypothetical protein